jgi:hypothetical protein
MSSAALLFLLAAWLKTSPQGFEWVKPEVAAQRLEGCGFSQVKPRFDEELQEEVLAVLDVADPTDEQLTCAAKVSLSSIYYLSMPDDFQQRYESIYWQLEKEHGKAIARKSGREWLSQHGLLARLPRYKKGEDEAFATKLEQLCGGGAKGALHSEFGPHAVNPAWARRELKPPPLGSETFECLTNAASATGFELGIISSASVPGK